MGPVDLRGLLLLLGARGVAGVGAFLLSLLIVPTGGGVCRRGVRVPISLILLSFWQREFFDALFVLLPPFLSLIVGL